jgi:hypothetical protein
MTYILIVLLWIAFAGLSAWIANDRGRRGLPFFLLSIILSPLAGIIAACAAMPDLDVVEERQEAARVAAKKREAAAADAIRSRGLAIPRHRMPAR